MDLPRSKRREAVSSMLHRRLDEINMEIIDAEGKLVGDLRAELGKPDDRGQQISVSIEDDLFHTRDLPWPPMNTIGITSTRELELRLQVRSWYFEVVDPTWK